MSSIEIKICGKDYTVKSDASSVDMEELAAFVDEKMKKLLAVKGKSSMLDVAVLTALNLGHELMELKQDKDGNDNQINQRLDEMIRKLKNNS
ncbi:MAG: cell division protein ZapA [Nitrospinaceae bacterium]|jgi:cell division protein ZapA|tara:strand:+ start:158 stop:433 length:276 start_codon:yes stop_codon:yes gene_type:complete